MIFCKDQPTIRIEALTFTPTGAETSMTWKESLSANYTDGMRILHTGGNAGITINDAVDARTSSTAHL